MGRHRGTRPRSGPDGVLLLDKAGSSAGRRGPTSHDVVDLVRRALGTRRVGHAGTLDPMASGLLVLLVGRGTKLAPYLSGADKVYEAEVCLGVRTDTLDADGRVVEQRPVPALTEEDIERALQRFRGTFEQRVPEVSAVRVGGERLHVRVRRGEQVEPPSRRVRVTSLRRVGGSLPRLRLSMHVSKGFYVRSLARDLGEALGTVAHLSALRRLRSGSFGVERALPFDLLRAAARGDEAARGRLLPGLMPLERAAAASMPTVRLQRREAAALGHGRAVPLEAVDGGGQLRADQPLALLDAQGLLAIGAVRDGSLRVVRGMR